MGDRWERGFNGVVQCLSIEPASKDTMRRLLEVQPVLLTPVHGDLNANNVLVGLNNWAPFLMWQELPYLFRGSLKALRGSAAKIFPIRHGMSWDEASYRVVSELSRCSHPPAGYSVCY